MKSVIIPILSIAFLTTPAVFADDPLQSAASAVIEKRESQSLTLTVTLKQGNKDSSFEAIAVAIDGSGLLATSIQMLEGKARLEGMMSMVMGGADAKKAGDITRVAWIREDATEIEGELVFRDELLDLAIIRLQPGDGITMPEAPTAAEAAPALLDHTVAIGRLSAGFQRAPRIGLGQVRALVTTPREFYQITGDTLPGTPIYNLRGEWLGLAVQIEDEMLVVPAAAILKSAESIPAPEKQ